MDLRVGQQATRSQTLTADHVQQFAKMTGDYNPLHFDTDFAAETRFGRLIVQGGLITGILNTLVATDMPGPGTVFMNQKFMFIAPVFIGDTITAQATILKVHNSKPVTQLAVTINRDDGEVVLEGEAWCYTFTPQT